MTTNIESNMRTFSPEDLERIAGVSRDLQRTWRRRGFLPSTGGKHAVFSLYDLISLTIKRRFTESGINTASAETSAAMAQMPVLSFLAAEPSNFAFEGDAIDDEMKRRVMGHTVSGSGSDGQFGFVALPEKGVSGVTRVNEIDHLADSMNADHFMGIVLNYEMLAEYLQSRIEGPIFTIKVSRSDE